MENKRKSADGGSGCPSPIDHIDCTYQLNSETINLQQVISRNLEGMADFTGANIVDAFKAPSDATPSFGNGSEGSLADDLKGSGVSGGNPVGPPRDRQWRKRCGPSERSPKQDRCSGEGHLTIEWPQRGTSTDKRLARTRDITSEDGYIL